MKHLYTEEYQHGHSTDYQSQVWKKFLFILKLYVIFHEAETVIIACVTLLLHMKHKIEGMVVAKISLNLL